MLLRLHIRNYAIIEDLILEPGKHFNAITGETGAGKSILMGALALVMGERADSSILMADEKCIVEATFSMPHNNGALLQLLQEESLDAEDPCIIRRELTAKGKSRAFINDTPVNLGVLQNITAHFVDLHQQFDNLDLADTWFPTEALDAVANALPAREKYTASFKKWEQVTTAIHALQLKIEQQQNEQDYHQYLYEELQQFHPQTDEIEHLEAQLKQVANREKLQQNLSATLALLQEGEAPITTQLKKAIQHLQSLETLWPQASETIARLTVCYEELKDAATLPEAFLEQLLQETHDLESLTRRYDEAQKLLKKHGVKTTSELLAVMQHLQEKLSGTAQHHAQLLALEQEQDLLLHRLKQEALQVRQLRSQAIAPLMQKTQESLHLMGMPNAAFRITLQEQQKPNAYGLDAISFELDANKSGHFLPIHKTASGGEMSRIMLALKTQMAGSLYMPTLIFDEIDTGISGEAAKQVGHLLQDLGQRHQVICITHQPQIAAMADTHFFVYKDMGKQGKISTHLTLLETEIRVQHIAEMITGRAPTPAALQHARELMERT